MIRLTNKLGNLVYVNPANITVMQICEIEARCGFTTVADSVELDYNIAVAISFVNGQHLIVQECLREINDKIEGDQDA